MTTRTIRTDLETNSYHAVADTNEHIQETLRKVEASISDRTQGLFVVIINEPSPEDRAKHEKRGRHSLG